MRTKLPILALGLASAAAWSQGTVTMSNNNEIYGLDGATGLGPATGGAYVAELVVNGTEVPNSICPVNDGYFFGPAATGGIVTLDGSAGAGGVMLAPGASMTYTIEVWNTAFGATFWAAAQNPNDNPWSPNGLCGMSASFTEYINQALPSPPNTGINFTGIRWDLPVPEPSTLALSGLGIGVAAFFALRGKR